MKKILISALFATSCLSMPAFAQTTTSDPAAAPAGASQTTPMPAGETAAEGAMAAGGANAGMQSQGGFYTYQEGNQVLGSGLMGARIMGIEGENIGSVDDLLLDRDGQVLAVIVGVGGFLGIGQKNVAIANDQLQFVLAQEVAASNEAAAGAAGTAGTAGTAAAPAGTAAMTGTAPVPADTAPATGTAMAPADAPATGAANNTAMNSPAGTGAAGADATGSAAGMNNGGANADLGWTGAGIDHIQVNFTRQQLQDAPAFTSAE
jgi:sporulation protein YlmC with PRC-barrel domain